MASSPLQCGRTLSRDAEFSSSGSGVRSRMAGSRRARTTMAAAVLRPSGDMCSRGSTCRRCRVSHPVRRQPASAALVIRPESAAPCDRRGPLLVQRAAVGERGIDVLQHSDSARVGIRLVKRDSVPHADSNSTRFARALERRAQCRWRTHRGRHTSTALLAAERILAAVPQLRLYLLIARALLVGFHIIWN